MGTDVQHFCKQLGWKPIGKSFWEGGDTIFDFIQIEPTCCAMTMQCTAFVWTPLKTPSVEEMIAHFCRQHDKVTDFASEQDFFFKKDSQNRRQLK